MSRTVLHGPTGRRLALLERTPADWSDSPPTFMAEEVPVSESPGTIDGSVFGFWIGPSVADRPGLEDLVERFIEDHDVVGVRFIRAWPKDCHSSLHGVCPLAE